ncbi:MAG: DUF983 domain-containing protein [Saprospiraceae bacterium]
MGLFKKGNKLYSILNLKCPRCHEGDLFHTSTWSFQDITGMPDNCPNCQQNYMPEPGFYYGAMFISYIFWGFFCVIFGGTCIMGLGWSVNKTTLVLLGISAIFFVWLFRTSRAAWFNAVVHYDTKFATRKS